MTPKHLRLAGLLFCIGSPIFAASSAAITGIIQSTSGSAVAAASVSAYLPETEAQRDERLLSASPRRSAIASGAVDDMGRFTIDIGNNAVADLSVIAAGYAPLTVRAQRGEDVGVVQLSNAMLRRGSVRANGKPAAGATVVWSGTGDYLTITDAKGDYSVPDPEAWATRLVVVHADDAVLDRNLSSGSRSGALDVTLSVGVPLKVEVVTETNTPMARAEIFIDGWLHGRTDANGTFTSDHVTATWNSIVAVVGSRIGRVQRGPNSQSPIRIRMRAGSVLSGQLLDASRHLFEPPRLTWRMNVARP